MDWWHLGSLDHANGKVTVICSDVFGFEGVTVADVGA